MRLMYPFKALKDSETGNVKAMSQLIVLVQYLFLECGQVDYVFSNKITMHRFLKGGLKAIIEVYEAKGDM
jgi:hypothetical protein